MYVCLQTVEAVGMNAPDGEQVMFVGKVIVDGPVEEWLIRVRARVAVVLGDRYPAAPSPPTARASRATCWFLTSTAD